MKEEFVQCYWVIFAVQDGVSYQIGTERGSHEAARSFKAKAIRSSKWDKGTEFRIYRYEVTRSLVL